MRRLLVLLSALVCASAAFAGTMTLDFGEFGTSSTVDATTVTWLGVTFGFSGGSLTYNGAIGGGTALVTDPALMGTTSGVLTLNFASPTTILDFDIALESVLPIPAAYTVTVGLNSYLGNTAPLSVFSEDHFTYSGGSPISTAVITFDSNSAPGFALDNLTFDSPAGPPNRVPP